MLKFIIIIIYFHFYCLPELIWITLALYSVHEFYLIYCIFFLSSHLKILFSSTHMQQLIISIQMCELYCIPLPANFLGSLSHSLILAGSMIGWYFYKSRSWGHLGKTAPNSGHVTNPSRGKRTSTMMRHITTFHKQKQNTGHDIVKQD